MSDNKVTFLDEIVLKGVKVNNLKNVSCSIKRGDFVVITGVSGSGKSSLAFDTLFAEGQRKYIESLSTYARQFINQIPKPEADSIQGICPTLAIEQKTGTSNKRSTVGTSTELYDFLKLLFSRVGKTYDPDSGQEVKKHNIDDVIQYTAKQKVGTKFIILSPILQTERKPKEELELCLQKGFGRVRIKDQVYFIEELLNEKQNILKGVKTEDLSLIIDRNVVGENIDIQYQRLADSIETAFFEGQGICILEFYLDNGKVIQKTFSNKFETEGKHFEEPSPNFFNFNNSLGACPTCQGTGEGEGIIEELVIQDPNLSVSEGCVADIDDGRTMGTWKNFFTRHSKNKNFPVHTPYKDLKIEDKNKMWNGDKTIGLTGIYHHFELIPKYVSTIHSRFTGPIACPDCQGSRLRKDALYVKVNGKTIADLTKMTIEELGVFFNDLKLKKEEIKIAKIIDEEVNLRVNYLLRLGMGYLCLNRLTHTLSGGEYQRIQLASSLGKGLVGVMYVLDEPSVGLHPRDVNKLIAVVKDLQNQDNTVVVVEHEESMMRAADCILDIGPEAGLQGGEIVFQGVLENLVHVNTLTADYLTGKKEIPIPTKRRTFKHVISLSNVNCNNIKNLYVTVPLQVLTVITGVSGSGKSTLIEQVLYEALKLSFDLEDISKHRLEDINFNANIIEDAEYISQNPIGRSSRSNCATYTKAWDFIREIFAQQPLAIQNYFHASYFSFNSYLGQCPDCEGEGVNKIDMQFMADIHLKCETCQGKRFINEILEVTYKEKNIFDILQMTVDEALIFFKDKKQVYDRLYTLQQVGLGYMALGQPSMTYSGGEAQRVKLASYLLIENKKKKPILFIFDEPSTGLHFEDIAKLLKAFEALIKKGHSIIVIEHNLEIIKSADWIIDMGPESGEQGGQVCFTGTPEQLAKETNNHTAHYLKNKINLL